MGNILAGIADGVGGKRIILEVPVRHGKSELASYWLPVWFLSLFPHLSIILATYEADFSAKWGKKVRNTLQDHQDILGAVVPRDSSAGHSWELTAGGGMHTCGVGGPVTGRGADCLPGWVLVETNDGPMRVDALHHNGYNPGILSVNHETGELEYRQIEASRELVSNDIYEIQTNSGRRIEATGKHRFFVCGKGYVHAKNLREGDRIIQIKQKAESLLNVRNSCWRKQPRNVSGLLQQPSEKRDRDDLLFLPEEIFKTSLRNSQGPQEGPQGCVLLEGVQPKSSRHQEQEKVYSVREANGEKNQEVLFGFLPREGKGQNKNATHQMSAMRQDGSSEEFEDDILLSGMCEQSPFYSDGRYWKFSLQNGHKLLNMVSKNEIYYSESGHEEVCVLSDQEETCSSSLGRRSKKQSNGESGGYVSGVPYNTPQIDEDTVSLVRRLHGKCIHVYDIQVEGNSNFFAEKILVHNCFLIDDPIKNAQEARSKTMRDNMWEWWDLTASTRLEPGASVILSMARWHEDDLAGRLKAHAKENPDAPQWEVVTLPALAEDNDQMGRKPGQALWPQRYNEEALNIIKASGKSQRWNALFQQRPSSEEGGMFHKSWFRYYNNHAEHYELLLPDGRVRRILKDNCWRFATADLALTTRTASDYTVVQIWDVEKVERNKETGTTGGAMILIDQYRERLEAPDVETLLKNVFCKYDLAVLCIEKAHYGIAVIQKFIRDGIPIRGMEADKDKWTRALLAGTMVENGMVFFSKGRIWLDDLEDELIVFDNGTNDDQVDALAYACTFAYKRDMWQAQGLAELPLGSLGRLLGMAKIFSRKNTVGTPFEMDIKGPKR